MPPPAPPIVAGFYGVRAKLSAKTRVVGNTLAPDFHPLKKIASDHCQTKETA
jgi:hypothetical protein